MGGFTGAPGSRAGRPAATATVAGEYVPCSIVAPYNKVTPKNKTAPCR